MEFNEYLATRPVDEQQVEKLMARMRAETRAYKLRELRESLGLSQTEVAARIGVSQNQVSKIERGDMANSKIGTIQRYLEALGGSLTIEGVFGTDSFQIA